MTRDELEFKMLQIQLYGVFKKSMTADPAPRIHAMAEPAWQEIERLRALLALNDAGEPVFDPYLGTR